MHSYTLWLVVVDKSTVDYDGTFFGNVSNPSAADSVSSSCIVVVDQSMADRGCFPGVMFVGLESVIVPERGGKISLKVGNINNSSAKLAVNSYDG